MNALDTADALCLRYPATPFRRAIWLLRGCLLLIALGALASVASRSWVCRGAVGIVLILGMVAYRYYVRRLHLALSRGFRATTWLYWHHDGFTHQPPHGSRNFGHAYLPVDVAPAKGGSYLFPCVQVFPKSPTTGTVVFAGTSYNYCGGCLVPASTQSLLGVLEYGIFRPDHCY